MDGNLIKRNKMKRSIIILFIISLIYSCKDTRLDNVPQDKVFIQNSGLFKVDVFNIDKHEISISVTKSGIGTQEAHANFTVDETLLKDYNDNNQTNYKLLPIDCYDILNKDININKHEETGLLKVIFNTSKISKLEDFRNYVLPLRLNVSGGISVDENKLTIVVVPFLTGAYVGFESIKELWFNESANLNLTVNENSVGAIGNYLTFSRNLGLMCDRITGRLLESKLNLEGITPWQPFFITNDDKNNLVACTLSAIAANTLAVYKWESYDKPAIEIFRCTPPSPGQYGRKLVVVGDINNEAYVIVSRTLTNEHYRWKISNGKVINLDNPDIIYSKLIETNSAGLQMISPINYLSDSPFYYTEPDNKKINLINGETISNIPGPLTKSEKNVYGWGDNRIYHIKYFEFNNAKYLGVLHSSAGKYYTTILDIENDHKSVFSSLIVANTTNPNTNNTGSFTTVLSEDGKSLNIYSFMTNTGVVCYQMKKSDKVN